MCLLSLPPSIGLRLFLSIGLRFAPSGLFIVALTFDCNGFVKFQFLARSISFAFVSSLAVAIKDPFFRQGPTCSGIYWKKTGRENL